MKDSGVVLSFCRHAHFVTNDPSQAIRTIYRYKKEICVELDVIADPKDVFTCLQRYRKISLIDCTKITYTVLAIFKIIERETFNS